MEEAYSELYQQFLRLQSLCLRQAALLHQLSTALHKQQGVSNGERSDMMSIPVQCTQEVPLCLYQSPQPPSAAAAAAAQGGVRVGPSPNAGMFSDLLARDMSELRVDVPCRRRNEAGVSEQKVASLSSWSSSKWGGGGASSSDASKDLGRATNHQNGGDRTMLTVTMPPMTDSPVPMLCGLNQSTDGPLMSDVALQSHVCEFCHAVFPGDTTTRGEFLRHLCTHVT